MNLELEIRKRSLLNDSKNIRAELERINSMFTSFGTCNSERKAQLETQEKELLQQLKQLNKPVKLKEDNNSNTIQDNNNSDINPDTQDKNSNNIIYSDGVWDVPMPTEKSVIQDKKFNYELLGEITLISNRKTEFLEDVDISEAEQHRYIYEKGSNSILSNREFLETISGNKWDTIKRNLRKLAKCNNDVVSYCEDEHGRKYYKIMPYTVGDNGKLQYVTIDSRVLDFLCRFKDSNSNTIKVYCVLLWLLWDNEKKCYKEKAITRDWLCKQIGLNADSGRNLTLMGDILFFLTECKLLERRKETKTIEVKGENTTVKTVYYYTVSDVNDFLKARNSYHK